MVRLALVTGATGAIGPTLVWHLVQQGYHVRTLSRNPPSLGLLPKEAEVILGNIADAPLVSEIVKDVDVIFHLAAQLHVGNPEDDLEQDYYHTNVEGTRHLIDAAHQAKVTRFIYFSTVKVYGEKASIPLLESQKPSPDTLYAKTKLLGEKVVQSANIESVILRLSAVYGDRSKGSWARLATAIQRGKFLPIGTLNNRRSLTYVDDVAYATQLAAEHPDVVGRIFNVVGYEAVSMFDIYSAIYSAYELTMPRLFLPAAPLFFCMSTTEKLLSLFGKKLPMSVDSLRQLVEDELYSGQALKQLGFKSRTTLIDSWKRIAQQGAGHC